MVVKRNERQVHETIKMDNGVDVHFYDNTDGKDIIINDRKTDIYKNISFCEQGCTYKGMDYDLMIDNCI